MAIVVGPSVGVKETNTGFSIYHQGDQCGLGENKRKEERGGGGGEGRKGGERGGEEEQEEEDREEEGMYVYHNETAIADEKPSPFFQFTDQEV